jgi:hypothetical protein
MAFDRVVDRPPHLDDRETPAQQRFGLLAHDVAHPLRSRPFGVVVVDAADDVADLAGFALLLAGGAQRVVEYDDTLGAAHVFDQRFALGIIEAPHLILGEEVGHRRAVRHEAETLAFKHKLVGNRPAVVQHDAVSLGVAAADSLIPAARSGDQRHQRVAVIHEIRKVRRDRVGRGIQFGEFCHLRLLRSIRRYDRNAGGRPQSRRMHDVLLALVAGSAPGGAVITCDSKPSCSVRLPSVSPR